MPLLLFLSVSKTGNAQHTEDKKALRVVIDSFLNHNKYSEQVFLLLENRTIPLTRYRLNSYINFTQIDVRYKGLDTSDLYRSFANQAPIDIDVLMDNRRATLIKSGQYKAVYTDGLKQGRYAQRITLSSPLYFDKGNRCFIEYNFNEGSSGGYSCILLKKNKATNWEIEGNVGGMISCGTELSPEEYFKFTGKRLDTTWHDPWQSWQ